MYLSKKVRDFPGVTSPPDPLSKRRGGRSYILDYPKLIARDKFNLFFPHCSPLLPKHREERGRGEVNDDRAPLWRVQCKAM